jgi:hypothetical protein
MNGLAGMENLIVVLALVLALLTLLTLLTLLLAVVLDKIDAVFLQQSLDLVEIRLELGAWVLGADDLELYDHVNQRIRGGGWQILGPFLIVVRVSERCEAQ